MRKYELVGMGNALLDILVYVTQEVFDGLELEKGSSRLVDLESQKRLLLNVESAKKKLGGGSGFDARRIGGGSLGNSTVAFSQLGGHAAFIGAVGDDVFGYEYRGDMESLGIALPLAPISDEITGSCLVVVTPDAERTMSTHLGAGVLLSENMLVEGVISPKSSGNTVSSSNTMSSGNTELPSAAIGDSDWLFLEGYQFANPEFGIPLLKKAVEIAKSRGTKIALTLSESFVVDCFRGAIDEILPSCSLVFGNETELQKFTGESTIDRIISKAADTLPNFVMTLGGKGAYVSMFGQKGYVNAHHCQPVDLTGAGDMFSGAMLFGLARGFDPLSAASKGCLLASQVIQQVGARLDEDLGYLWNNA